MSQKALLLLEAQGKFEVGTRPIPKPGPGELLVKIKATALNPVDWKIQGTEAAFFIWPCTDGEIYKVSSFFVTEYPAVLGTDSAGVVEEVGEDVTGFAKGDAV